MEITHPHAIPLAAPGPQKSLSPEESLKLRKACADFEALLNQQMLATMRDSATEPEGLFEKSAGEKLFQSLMDQELAEKMAEANSSGLGNMLFEQLSKTAGR